MKEIFVIGVGLIGGSLALDIKKLDPSVTIYGIDNNEEHLDIALAKNVIDKKANLEDIKNADLVIVAIPVNATVKQLPNILDMVSDDTVVVDVGSTKQDICLAVEEHPKRRNFLATHPIAGTEFSGPSAALEGLYPSS